MTQERIHQHTSAIDSGAEEPAGLARLRRLVRAAQDSQGEARVALAGEINAALVSLREPGHESEEARLLVSHLDAHAFDDLVDAQGTSSRKEAVQTLLSLGFPHALQVDPGDLAFTRKEQQRERVRQRPRPAEAEEGSAPLEADLERKLATSRTLAVFLAGIPSLLLAVKGIGLMVDGSGVAGLLALLQLLLAAGSTGYLLKAMPPLNHQTMPIVALFFSVLLAGFLVPFGGWQAVLAAVGACAAIFALVAWQYEDAGPEAGGPGRNPFK